MEILNYKKIIEQEFEKEKEIRFKVKNYDAVIKIKKIDLLTRNKIEKLKLIGVINVYDYDYNETGDIILKSAKTEITEKNLESDNKILSLLLNSIIYQNLKPGNMDLNDWLEFGTYFKKEFDYIINEIQEFNGLKKNI